MALIPNSERYDENGNLTHFGIVDPSTGGPALIPHVGGNYAMFGGTGPIAGGGSGYQTMEAGGMQAAGSAPSQGGAPPPEPIPSPADIAPPMVGGAPPPTMTLPANTGGASGTWAAPLAAADTAVKSPAPVPAPANTIENTGRTYEPLMMAPITANGGHGEHSDSWNKNVLDKTLIDQYQRAASREGAALDAKAAADIAVSKTHQAAAEADYNAIAGHVKKQEDARASYEMAAANKQTELDADTDKFLNAKIDANHFWADKTTGDKVMAGIAVAMGALGGALTGAGGNMGLDIINKAIDRDLKAQEINLQKQGQVIGIKKGLLADYRQQFGDTERAKDAAFIAYQKGVSQHFEAMAMSANDPGIKANISAQKAKIDQDIAARLMDLTKKTVGHNDAGGGQWSKQSAPRIAPKTMDPKEMINLTTMDNTVNKNNQIIDLVKKNPDMVGKPAAFWSTVKSALGLPHDATQLQIQDAAASNLESAYQSAGRLTPAKQKLIDSMRGTISMPAEDFINTLHNENRELQTAATSQRKAYAQSGFVVPGSEVQMTNDEQRAAALKK